MLPLYFQLLDDGLPNHICKHCVHQLKAAYKFKTKCEHTDTILRKHLQKTQPANTSSIIVCTNTEKKWQYYRLQHSVIK